MPVPMPVPMLVVDACCLYEVVADTTRSEQVRRRLAADPDQAAPHIIDLEVISVVRRHHRAGDLDATAAAQAVDDLAAWPGERYGHQVRGWDAAYVALAEALRATLVTLDGRLAAAPARSAPHATSGEGQEVQGPVQGGGIEPAAFQDQLPDGAAGP
ncbi:MAG: type II toxin-antitoxin system VapC family toxin [Acidimicrobiales bacterium]